LSLIFSEDPRANLQTILKKLRQALAYSDKHLSGIPPLLFADFPRDLVDVLLLFSVKRGETLPWSKDDSEVLTAFTLHWLFLVAHNGKAALQVFRHVREEESWAWSEDSIGKLINDLEKEGFARYLPRPGTLPELQSGVDAVPAQPPIRTWAKRFTEADRVGELNPGDALREISTRNELIQRALMWLQREYLKAFDYDPTSDRDEDLPIDLDHIVPDGIFGFDWRYRDKRLQTDIVSNPVILENFWHHRITVGNSLGNFRWLAVSDNRSRGKGDYVLIPGNEDLVKNPDAWNRIISGQPWSPGDIGEFQRLIDTRTLQLFEKLIRESGIARIMGLIEELDDSQKGPAFVIGGDVQGNGAGAKDPSDLDAMHGEGLDSTSK